MKPVFNKKIKDVEGIYLISNFAKTFSDCRCSCVVHVLLCWYFTNVSTTNFERSGFLSAKKGLHPWGYRLHIERSTSNQINCKLPGHQKRSSNFLVPRCEKGRPRAKKTGEIRGVVRLRRKRHEWVGGFSTTSFATKAGGFYSKAHQLVWREVLRTGRSVKDHTAGTLQQMPFAGASWLLLGRALSFDSRLRCIFYDFCGFLLATWCFFTLTRYEGRGYLQSL